MNIGIDIDNTLTDIEKELFDAANKYTKKLRPNFKYVEQQKYDGFTNMADFYSSIFGWKDDEIVHFFRNQRLEVVDNAKPRENAKKIIEKLKNEGNKIYIITARTKKFDDIPYERAKKWLDKNGIVYDKLIVEATDKAKVCYDLNIKLFIDDQLNNCISLASNGIHTIRLTDSIEIYDNVVNIKNWNDVYEYISKLK